MLRCTAFAEFRTLRGFDLPLQDQATQAILRLLDMLHLHAEFPLRVKGQKVVRQTQPPRRNLSDAPPLPGPAGLSRRQE